MRISDWSSDVCSSDLRKAMHHLARLRKDRPQRARWLDEQIGQIFELADPDRLFVPTLTAQRQAMFAVGYYHQKNGFYRRKDGGAADADRKIVVSGKGVSVRVDLGGRRIIKKKI